MIRTALSLAIMAALAAAPVAARDRLYALPSEGATASYDRGVATVQIIRPNGIVQLTPIGMDHGGMTFLVAVFNNSDRPVNFDLPNIRASAGGQPIRAMSAEDLIRKANNRAFWRSVGVGLVGAFAVAAASSRTNTYYSSYRSRYGSSFTVIRYPSLAGQLEADRLTGTTAYAISAIQGQLAETRAALSDQIVQTMTVQPGDSYAGRVVLAKVAGAAPRDIDVVIDWNGDRYPFALRLQDSDTVPPPSIQALTLRSSKPGVALAAQDFTNTALPQGAVPINGGYLKPAKTASGFCIMAGADYRGTGSSDQPAVTDGRPRCERSN